MSTAFPSSLAAPAGPEVHRSFDAIVIGAGFAGLYMLHRLRQMGLRARVLEAGSGVGGTWYWNGYPGARCDVDSLQYSYSWSKELEQEWTWSERYAPQPEILRYLNHVADRFDLRRDIDLDTKVVSGQWIEDPGHWEISTQGGKSYRARILITAVGCLSDAQTSPYADLDRFCGTLLHTGRWPHHAVDFTGQRVGVIGTGSSGIQLIPELAKQAAEVWVFQRTPNFSIPAWNGPIDQAYQQDWRLNHSTYRARARATRSGILYDYGTRPASEYTDAERQLEMEQRWRKGGTNFSHAFSDGYTNPTANEHLAEFVRNKIRETVHDPRTAERLMPRGHALGTKRLCVDTDYYKTYNLPHVHLVDLRQTPITKIQADGVEAGGESIALDAVVMATGYDAVTGPLQRLRLVGEHGATLDRLWAEGPETYLGLMIAGFPNLLTITGPGSPSILTNVVVSIEQHVDWIAGLLQHMRDVGLDQVVTTTQAQQSWARHAQEVAEGSLFKTAQSWYTGANVPGKPRVLLPYVGGFARYAEHCDEVARTGYPGFEFSRLRS